MQGGGGGGHPILFRDTGDRDLHTRPVWVGSPSRVAEVDVVHLLGEGVGVPALLDDRLQVEHLALAKLVQLVLVLALHQLVHEPVELHVVTVEALAVVRDLVDAVLVVVRAVVELLLFFSGGRAHLHNAKGLVVRGVVVLEGGRIRVSAAGTHHHHDKRQREHPREEHRTGVN